MKNLVFFTKEHNKTKADNRNLRKSKRKSAFVMVLYKYPTFRSTVDEPLIL